MKNRADRLAMVLAAIAGAVLLWWLVLGRPASSLRKAAVATATATVAEKRGNAAADAARIVERHFTHVRDIERIRDDAIAEIAAAPDAAAVHAAAARAVCMLAPPAGDTADPACQLPRPRAGKPAG